LDCMTYWPDHSPCGNQKTLGREAVEDALANLNRLPVTSSYSFPSTRRPIDCLGSWCPVSLLFPFRRTFFRLSLERDMDRIFLELFRLIRPLVVEESDKCGIMAESGEDVAW